MSRKDLIDLNFFLKLFSLKLARLWDLNHNSRMDFIDEGDTSFPDPVHSRKLLLCSHNKEKMQYVGKRYEATIVAMRMREVSKKKGRARGGG